MNLLQAWMSFRVYLKHPTSRTRTRTRLSESGLPLIELCHAPGNPSLKSNPYLNKLFDQVSKPTSSKAKDTRASPITGSVDQQTDPLSGGRETWVWPPTSFLNRFLSAFWQKAIFICQAYTWEHLGDILDEIIINGEQRSLESLKGVGMKYPEGKCFEVPHSNIDLESTGGIDFKMTFKRSNLSKSSLSIFVTDPFRSSWRRDLFTFR